MKLRVKRHAVIQPQDLSYRLIPLTANENAIVDTSDIEWLNQWNWHTVRAGGGNVYARRRANKKIIYMHRQILECEPGQEGDHISGNTLDNRRNNLRKCTHAQNDRNRKLQKNNHSGFKGVSWDKRRGKWQSQIKSDGKCIHLGYFDGLLDAARAHDEAAKKYHGKYASLNHYGPNPEKCQ